MKLILEPRRYSVVLTTAFRPAKCVKCGKFVGEPNLAGRTEGRRFVCVKCRDLPPADEF